MNSKMTTNSQLSTTEPKNITPQKQILRKQLNRKGIREMDITWRVFSGEGKGKNRGEGTGNKKQNWLA